MAIVRRTQSVVGNVIVNKVKDFILDNAEAMENDTDITPEHGAEALGHAIAYGIALALSSGPVKGAFAAGICPPGGDVVPMNATGDKIFNVLEKVAKE